MGKKKEVLNYVIVSLRGSLIGRAALPSGSLSVASIPALRSRGLTKTIMTIGVISLDTNKTQGFT